METLGGLWSAGASALAVLTGRSANVDDDSKLSRDPSDVSTASGDEDEHAHSLEDAVPSTPSGDLHEDWMMVVEDRASVARAVPMGDVHAQRIRNRPGLTRLWDGVDAADLLIERPLVGVGRAVALTYAAAAASGLPWATPATTVAASATTEPELDSDRSPAYIRVGRVYDTTQASASRRGVSRPC